MIPYGRQHITQEDIDEVIKVLKSDYLTSGPAVTKFENIVKDFTGAKHAIALTNATSGLHVACLAIGLKEGDIGVTVPISFLASSNCIIYCGAEVDFVDIEEDSVCMSPSRLEEYISKKGPPKVVIPVDFAGVPADLPKIWELSKRYNFKVIEDASHSVGSEYIYNEKLYKCGDCSHADLVVFSFHPVKTVTAGEGGMVLTNDDELAKRVRMYANHGMEREYLNFKDWKINNYNGKLKEKIGDSRNEKAPWLYQQQLLGYNYRITDIQSALGTSQFKRIDQTIKKRKKIFSEYQKAFKGNKNIQCPIIPNDTNPAWHLYIIRYIGEDSEWRIKTCNFLRENGIFSQVHYIPIHLQPWYQDRYNRNESFPVSEKYYDSCLSIPLFPDLTEDELDKVIKLINQI
jgi:UDP-4-amino-4,6-dideoxy-N-acetyl-beta-L-altrosamine transaminase